MADNVLAETGRMLYGTRWRSQLALAVGVSIRTVLYWEDRPPPPKHRVWSDLRGLVRARAANLANLHHRLPVDG